MYIDILPVLLMAMGKYRNSSYLKEIHDELQFVLY